ncbi:hypothetical protein, partial [Roseibium sp. MMSF_3544]
MKPTAIVLSATCMATLFLAGCMTQPQTSGSTASVTTTTTTTTTPTASTVSQRNNRDYGGNSDGG